MRHSQNAQEVLTQFLAKFAKKTMRRALEQDLDLMLLPYRRNRSRERQRLFPESNLRTSFRLAVPR